MTLIQQQGTIDFVIITNLISLLVGSLVNITQRNRNLPPCYIIVVDSEAIIFQGWPTVGNDTFIGVLICGTNLVDMEVLILHSHTAVLL